VHIEKSKISFVVVMYVQSCDIKNILYFSFKNQAAVKEKSYDGQYVLL
jgi:hypothetical protein